MTRISVEYVYECDLCHKQATVSEWDRQIEDIFPDNWHRFQKEGHWDDNALHFCCSSHLDEWRKQHGDIQENEVWQA